MRASLKDLTGWSIERARTIGLAELVADGPVSRMRLELGGSHTVVTYPPLDSLHPVAAEEIAEAIAPTSALNLYAHVAFCEHLCPFCHYAKTYSPIDGDNGRVGAYLDALELEMARWSELLAGSTVSVVDVVMRLPPRRGERIERAGSGAPG